MWCEHNCVLWFFLGLFILAFGKTETFPNLLSPMSSGCPPQSPAVAKSEIAVEGECPLLAATFAYWDNILGPRVRYIWAPKGDQLMLLSDGEVTFLANHTLNGEILRSAECGAVDVKFFVLAEKGVIIVSLIFDGELKGDKNTCALSVILPQTELAFYLPLHTICVERLKHVIRKGRIWMQKVAGYSYWIVIAGLKTYFKTKSSLSCWLSNPPPLCYPHDMG